MLLLKILLFWFLVAPCLCGSYLFYMPMVMRSMYISFMPLVRELAARGHNITLIHGSRLAENITGLTEIVHRSYIGDYGNYATEVSLVQDKLDADDIMWVWLAPQDIVRLFVNKK